MSETQAESTMLLVCPHCATSYRVAEGSLGATGRSVRCVTCATTWFAAPGIDATDDGTLDQTGPSYLANEMDADPMADDAIDMVRSRDLPVEPYDPEPAPHDFDTANALAADERPDQVIDVAPSIVPDSMSQSQHDPVETIDVFAARRAKSKARIKASSFALKRPNLATVIFGLLAALAVLAMGRAQIVRMLPQTASLYAAVGLPVNLRGLAFDGIKTSRDIHEGSQVLVVEGQILATTGRTVEVPRLRFAVVNAAGREIYTWMSKPTRSLLPPGEALAFRSRLAAPPIDGRDVTVRFANRNDMIAGMR